MAERYLGEEIFKLGFGLMRLPKNEDKSIDIEQTKKMVDLFIEAGGTYFDTAYVYDNGESEKAAKLALVDRYPRESYTLCTKMNAWLGSPSKEETQRQFEISLERTGVDFFDFYLLHAIQTDNGDLYEKYGIWDFVRGLKEEGKIRYYGFSYHSGPEYLDQVLTEHPDVDFIQLQVNYADMEDPEIAARANMEVAAKHGKPFVIMEPVKGGTLANPIPAVQEIFQAANPDASAASWAIRFAASQPNVITVLSGMSNVEQMEDNLSYMRNFQPLSEEESAAIDRAREALASVESIPCTACKYCMDGCPMEIKIPDVFKARNRQLVYNDTERAKQEYRWSTSGSGNPRDCIACGQCESACPQQIPIIERLAECADALE